MFIADRCISDHTGQNVQDTVQHRNHTLGKGDLLSRSVSILALSSNSKLFSNYSTLSLICHLSEPRLSKEHLTILQHVFVTLALTTQFPFTIKKIRHFTIGNIGEYMIYKS